MEERVSSTSPRRNIGIMDTTKTHFYTAERSAKQHS